MKAYFTENQHKRDIQNIMFALIIIIFCLIRFPSIYLIPIGKSSLFLSHNIARICIILLFLASLFTQQRQLVTKNRALFTFILIYLVATSISIVTTQNMNSFLTAYKDLVLALMLGYGVFMTISKQNISRFISVFVIVTLISLIIELLIYIFPQVSLNIFAQVVNEHYLSFFIYQYGRNRMFGDTLNEVFLPLFFYLLINSKTIRSSSSLVGIILSFFSMFISGWRTKAVMFFFGLACGLILLGKRYKKVIFLSLFIMVIIFGVLNYITRAINNQSVLDRFIDIDTTEAKQNASRIKYWQDAISIGFSSPLFGVGLGNYFDNLSQKSKQENMNSSLYQTEKFIIIDDPHNLFFSAFANTGFVGLFSLLAMIYYFFITDLKSLYTQNKLLQSLILTFWSLFIYSFFNPWMYFSYLSFFWLLRGFVEKIKLLHLNEKTN